MNTREHIEACQDEINKIRNSAMVVDRASNIVLADLNAYLDVCQSFINMLSHSTKDQYIKTAGLMQDFLSVNSPYIVERLDGLSEGRSKEFNTAIESQKTALTNLDLLLDEDIISAVEFPEPKTGLNDLRRLCDLAIAKIDGEKNYEYYCGNTANESYVAPSSKIDAFAELDNAIAALRRVKNSDDPGKMKKTLDNLHQHLTDVKELYGKDIFNTLTGKDLLIMIKGMIRKAELLPKPSAASSTASVSKGMQVSPKQFQSELPAKQIPLSKQTIRSLKNDLQDMLFSEQKLGKASKVTPLESDTLSKLFANVHGMHDDFADLVKLGRLRDEAKAIIAAHEKSAGKSSVNSDSSASKMLARVKDFVMNLDIPEQRKTRSGAVTAANKDHMPTDQTRAQVRKLHK